MDNNMKLKDLLYEKTKLKQSFRRLPASRRPPKAIDTVKIKRKERGEDADVTDDDIMKILRNPDFSPNFKNSNYVFQIEYKKERSRKKVALVHTFKVNDLPDSIDLNIPPNYNLKRAKVYIKGKEKEKVTQGNGTQGKEKEKVTQGNGSKIKIGTTRSFEGKPYMWNGEKWVPAGNSGTDNEKGKVPAGTPLLKRGSKGESVEQLQTLLGLTGDSIDGKYGTETAAWLTVWQEEHNLPADGIYGPKTAAKMEIDPVPVKDQARAKQLTNQRRAGVGSTKKVDKVGGGINIFKKLESKYPKVFKGSYTFKLPGGKAGKTVKRLAIGSPTQAETYEEAMKKNITGGFLNTNESLLLRIFTQLSGPELTTLFNRYQQINNTKLAQDLKDEAFDESEMTKLENIFLKKGLKLSRYLGSYSGGSF